MNLQNEEILLKVKNLSKYYPQSGGFFDTVKGTIKAVDTINFSVHKGTTFGLVGESGCGKTTTGRLIVRVLEPTNGEIYFNDEKTGVLNLLQLSKKEMQKLRQKIQMIFQDPYASLDPRMTILQIVGEPLRANKLASGNDYKEKVADTLNSVGLLPDYMSRYPHAFSGGQRQRIGIARALVTSPQLVVADEPVSALDVSVQAQILNLLKDLQEKLKLTYIFVAHDLSVIHHICDRVAVMYVGKLVEIADRSALFSNPKHPYTEALLSVVPKPDPCRISKKVFLTGEVADASNPPSGCYFHPRCRYAKEICKNEEPVLQEGEKNHSTACHFDLELEGIYD